MMGQETSQDTGKCGAATASWDAPNSALKTLWLGKTSPAKAVNRDPYRS